MLLTAVMVSFMSCCYATSQLAEGFFFFLPFPRKKQLTKIRIFDISHCDAVQASLLFFCPHIYQHLLIVTQKLLRCKFNEFHTSCGSRLFSHLEAVTHRECVRTSSWVRSQTNANICQGKASITVWSILLNFRLSLNVMNPVPFSLNDTRSINL